MTVLFLQILDFGFLNLVFEFGFWILGFGFWILNGTSLDRFLDPTFCDVCSAFSICPPHG